MSRIFYRKRFSDYLGEQRAIDDIVQFYQPDGGVTPTPTPVPVTPTPTPSITPTNTLTPTPSITPTNTPSVTPTSTLTPTPSITPTNTNTPTTTTTPTVTPTNTNTPSVTPTITPTKTTTPTPTLTPTPTASPSGGFTPVSISGLTTWFEPTLGVVKSGAYVVSWTDQVGGRVAVATSPTNFTQTDILNGYSGITAPSGNVDALVWSTFNTYPAFTIFGVIKRIDNGNPQYFAGYDGNQGIGSALDTGGFKPFIYDGASGMVFFGGTAPLNIPQYYSWSLSTTSGEIKQNGVQVASNSGNPNAQKIDRIFSNANTPNNMEGTIWEALIYNRVLIPAELTQVQNYLSTKYGI